MSLTHLKERGRGSIKRKYTRYTLGSFKRGGGVLKSTREREASNARKTHSHARGGGHKRGGARHKSFGCFAPLIRRAHRAERIYAQKTWLGGN